MTGEEEVAASGPPLSRRAAMVGLLGVGSLPGMLFCGLGSPMAVIALGLAPSARREVVASGGQFSGLGVIRAARICSVISLVLAVLMVIAVLLVFDWLVDQASEPDTAGVPG